MTSFERAIQKSYAAADVGGNGNGNGSATHSTQAGGIFNQPAPEGHARTTSAVLGEIVWLMSQSPLHKQFFISDLEWFVMAPIPMQQFRLFYAKNKPIGVVLWARVSPEVEARLAEGVNKLRPQDWRSGDKLWVVEVIAPFGAAEELVKDLKAHVFPNEKIKFVAMCKDGKEVREI